MPTKTAEPKSRCDRCGKTDDHPKHVIQALPEIAHGQEVHHPDDTDQDGFIRYHFDCDHDMQDHPAAVKQRELALKGVRGDRLRAAIKKGL